MKDKIIEIKTDFTLLEDGSVRFSFPYDGPFLSLEDLQKERITHDTKLLYFVCRDEKGIHSGWAWSKEIRNLYLFLYNEILAKAISLEYGVKRGNKDGFRVTLEGIAKKIAKGSPKKLVFPEEILIILTSAFLLECDATKGLSLLERVAPLEEVAGKLFYFVTFQFFDGFEAALNEVKHHKKLPSRSSLRTNLIGDTSISDDF